MDLKTLRTERTLPTMGLIPASELVSQAPAFSCLVGHEDAEVVKQATLVLRRICRVGRVEAVYAARDLEEWASREEWDLLLVAERMSLQDPIQAVERLRKRAPRAVILVLGESDEQEWAFDLVGAGADYYFGASTGLASVEFPLVMQRLLEARSLRLEQEYNRLRLECLSALLTEPMLEIDAMGQIRHASRSLAMRAGLLMSDLRGGPFAGLVQPSDVERWHQWLRLAQSGSGVPTPIYVHLRRGRREAARGIGGGLEMEIAPVHGADGRFWGAAGVAREAKGGELKANAVFHVADLLESAAGLCSILMAYADIARRAVSPSGVAGGEGLHQVEGAVKTVEDLIARLRGLTVTRPGSPDMWRRRDASG